MYIPDGVQDRSRGIATGRAAIRARYLDDWKTITEQPASVEWAKAAEDGTILVVGNWHLVIPGAKGPRICAATTLTSWCSRMEPG